MSEEKFMYVVSFAGVEYNDEIYYIGGEHGGISECAYEDEHEAREYLKSKLLFTLADFKIGDFGYDETEEAAWGWCVDNGIETETGYGSDSFDTRLSYPECIKLMEERKVDWMHYVPSLVEIHKVRVVSAEVDQETLDKAKSNTVQIAKELQ